MSTNVTRRLAYKRDLKPYLDQLNALVNCKVVESDLLSLEETDSIREKSKLMLDVSKVRKFRIDFSEKSGKRFKDFIQCLSEGNSRPLYIWLNYSNSCGLYQLDSIFKFNFDFDYLTVHQGIISLLTNDMSENMILDFFEDSSGEQVVEIELTGKNWPSCIY